MLRNIRIGYKLALMIGIPLACLLYFAGTGIRDKLQNRTEMAELQQLAELSRHLGGVVHELQRERGMTAGFIGSRGQKFAQELPQQRTQADQRIDGLQRYLEAGGVQLSNAELERAIKEARRRLADLKDRRDAVSGLRIPALEAVEHYSTTIRALLAGTSVIASLSSDGRTAIDASAYASFLQAKELAGIERALLTNTFAADRFAPGAFNRFIANSAAQQSWLNAFNATATQEHRDYLHSKVSGAVVEEVERMKNVATEHAAEGHFGIEADQWFQRSTARIDLLAEVEDRLSGDLVERAAALGVEFQ